MSQDHDDHGGGHGGDAGKGKGGGGHGGGGHGGGGGHEEEGEHGAPEWLISFADNVALLMGFFVIMLALALAAKAGGATGNGDGTGQPSNAQLDFAIGVREAFNNPVKIDSTNPADEPLVRRLRERLGQNTEDDSVPGRRDRVLSPDRGTQFAVSGILLFEAGHAELSADSQNALAQFAERARGLRQVVEVRGHTSLGEIEGDPVASMKLSYQRAFRAAETLASMGVPWKQIRLMALGANERDSGEMSFPERKLRNQRVELILTPEITRD